MRYVATAWYWLVFITTSLVGVLLSLVLWVVARPFDPHARLYTRFIMAWSHQYLRVWPGWRVRVHHRERLPKAPMVLVANHQSAADALAVMGLGVPYKFVAKASLFPLPIVGWVMKLARFIPIERGKVQSTAKMVSDCRVWLQRGQAVMVFPEGTYSGGKRLLPFKRGAFLLAFEEKVPLVPVVLKGTPELIFEDGPWFAPRARVDVEVLEPIRPQDFPASDEALSQQVRALFEQALGRR